MREVAEAKAVGVVGGVRVVPEVKTCWFKDKPSFQTIQLYFGNSFSFVGVGAQMFQQRTQEPIDNSIFSSLATAIHDVLNPSMKSNLSSNTVLLQSRHLNIYVYD